MADRPSIGVVASITNPLTTGYFAYLAFADSWSKIVDEVIIVDGGTADGSLEFLREWIGNRSNIRIVKSPLTYWGAGGQWHVLQSCINLNIGLLSLSTDLGIPTGADHILDSRTTSHLYEDLRAINNLATATCCRGKPGARGIIHHLDDRTPLVNLRLLRRQGVEPVLGLDISRGLCADYVLYPKRKSCFADPITGVCKPIYAGYRIPLQGRGKVSMEVISYGHFFFTMEQCLSKIRRWDRTSARFLGIAPKRDLELRLLNGLYSIKGFRSKEEVMAWDHPPEILRVIDRFYEPGMLGGAIREVSSVQTRAVQALRKLLGLERRLHTFWMRAQGYRGLKELHQWVPVDAPEPELLDVSKVYAEQDRFLPLWARV